MDQGFDYRWLKHPLPQATVRSTWVDKAGIAPEELAGKRILDAGCGCGRNSKLLAEAGAIVTGIDSSPHAVEAAAKNCPSGKFVICDLLSLTSETLEPFDFIFSHGVLHHTDDPKRAFLNLSNLLVSGGQLNVWVYTQPCRDELMPYHDMLHEITKACPPKVLYSAIEKYAIEIREAAKYGKVSPDLQEILKVSVSDDDDECISDTFDWHCPQNRFYYNAPEVMEWFREADISIVWVGAFPVSVRGIRK